MLCNDAQTLVPIRFNQRFIGRFISIFPPNCQVGLLQPSVDFCDTNFLSLLTVVSSFIRHLMIYYKCTLV